MFGGVRLNPFRFIHTADLHLGTPFQSAARRMSPEWSRTLRAAVEQSFNRIVDVAIREQVDFITIAGDLYDSETVPLSVHLGLVRAFERLRDAGISVFVSHGNHDPLVAPPPLDWPETIHVFAAREDSEPGSAHETVPSVLVDVHGTRVQISGFSYSTSGSGESRAEGFERNPTADFAIALYHGVVGTASGHEPYYPTTVAALSERQFDFWGLGHIHQPQVLQAQRPSIVYPGNPQGRHSRESGVRGVVVVDVDSRGAVTLTSVPTSVVRFETVEVSVDGAETVTQILDRAVATLSDVFQQGNGQAVVARVVFTGSPSVGEEGWDAAGWQDSLCDEAAAKGWPLVVEQVTVRTTPWVDVAVLRRSHSYAAEVLRVLDEWREDPTAAIAELGMTLQPLFRPGSGFAQDSVSGAEIREWCNGAERRLLQIYSEAGGGGS